MTDAKIAELEAKLDKEINQLHEALESKGVNSRGVTDVFGRRFSVPVDAEHKATQLVLFNFDNPHNRAFHTSWFGFFSSFFSMFASAPLIVFMKKPSSLNMKGPEIGAGNMWAVSTNIVMRVVVGFLSDLLGARRGMSFLLLITIFPIFGMMFVTNGTGWIVCRACIGIALATFVTCQVWNSQMYAKKVVGFANATAAGWGNLGGGVTNLVMPFVFVGIYNSLSCPEGTPEVEKWGCNLVREDRAWRLAFLLPLALHLVGGIGVLTGRDLPDGNMKELESAKIKQKGNGMVVARTGFTNVNAWILTITYGMCFGIELTMNSIMAPYYHTYHGFRAETAGSLAALYGMMNLFARSWGGLLSDWSNKHFGMRGRIWSCWIVQTIEGVFCILMASVTLGMEAPHKRPMTQAYTYLEKIKGDTNAKWVPVNNTLVMECSTLQQSPPSDFMIEYDVDDSMITMHEPPFARDGAAANCILHQNAAGLCLFLMICFSLCVQASEGLTYGIVPYVSRPALGIVSGMAGAGGNLGAVVSIRAFFFSGNLRRDEGLLQMGIMVIICTATLFGIYFPEFGGMLFKAGGLGKYDPQLVKPPADYRGADSMDYSKKADTTKTADADVAVNAA